MKKNIFFSFIRLHWEYFISSIFVKKGKLDSSQEYVFLVDEARKEWQWTDNLIQEVTDDNLIDQAIYCQSAAERKYVHLLKQAAREGIKADLGTVVSLALANHNKVYGGVGMCQQKHGRSY